MVSREDLLDRIAKLLHDFEMLNKCDEHIACDITINNDNYLFNGREFEKIEVETLDSYPIDLTQMDEHDVYMVSLAAHNPEKYRQEIEKMKNKGWKLRIGPRKRT